MLTKLKEVFTRPVDDSLTVQQLDQLSTLIELRINQIGKSENYVGKSHCFCDSSEPDLLYFLKTENPLSGSTFCHPLTRKNSAFLDITQQAGRVATSFISFVSAATFYTVHTKYDYTRGRSFSKLQATAWNEIPATVNEAELNLLLPLAYTPDTSMVIRNTATNNHFRIKTVEKMATHNLCGIEEVEVNQF